MTTFSPNKLYKDGKSGKIAGVCAGLGDYFGIQPNIIRAGAIIGSLFGFFLPVLVIYVILAAVLDEKPSALRDDPQEDAFWRTVRTRPDYSVYEMKSRFREMEKRTRQLEAYITSKRFRLQRELSELED